MQEVLALTNAVLAVTHPEQYAMAVEDAKQLRRMKSDMNRPEEAEAAFRLFPSVWHAASVICNRQAMVHQDKGTKPEWYDLLMTFGTDDDTLLEIPKLRYRFRYLPRTSVLFSGKSLAHGVSESKGERMAMAFYLKENIQSRMGAKPAWYSFWSEVGQLPYEVCIPNTGY